MFERKRQLVLTIEEYSLLVKVLIDCRNKLIEQGRYTDAIDDVLLKICK